MDPAGADTAPVDIVDMGAYGLQELAPSEVVAYVDTVEEPCGSLRENCYSYKHLLGTGIGCLRASSRTVAVVGEMAGSSKAAIPELIS